MNKTRIELNNILWATSLTRSSENALPYVLALARRYGARVFMLHVVPTTPSNLPAETLNNDLFEEGRLRAEEMVLRLHCSGRLQCIRPLLLIREGETGEALCRTVRDYDIDLVVIGAHARRGLNYPMLGSATGEIVRRTPCAVLTVGGRCSDPPAVNNEFRNVVCATDLSPDSRVASDHALSLARQHQARLTLVHVVEGVSRLYGGRAQLVQALRTRLDELVEGGAEVKLTVEFGTTATRILAVAKEQHADLIVLGTRQPSASVERLPGATVYPVISNASCPVLTVPNLLMPQAVFPRMWDREILKAA